MSFMKYIDSLKEEVKRLKRRRNAVILAHNYELPEVQDVADYVGDSLELARKAINTDADVIVLAGVYFMAEVSAILNPDRTVLTPNPDAGCPLAHFLTADIIRRYREKHPRTPLVVYINSYANVKQYADYVVTSASASKLISKLDCEEIMFGPDKNLASYVAGVTGKNIIPIPSNGHCPVHEFLINEYFVRRALQEHPEAKLIIHPEAPPEAQKLADSIGSTSQMIKAVGSLGGDEFLLGTEEGLAYRARRLYPSKRIYPVNPGAVCVDMKKITLKNIAEALDKMKFTVRIDEKIAGKVRETLNKSLEMVK